MVYGGGVGKRVRRYRAAVYMQCASERDVDLAFDALVLMMLSDRREDYLWGVLLDLTPSTLFRTFGDYEIEDRVRYRFGRICAEYGECGFFAILRGRRYGGKIGFRCENGIYGAVKLLCGGSGDGCSVRLCTEDVVKRSDRIFIWDARGGDLFPAFPCDITRSSYLDGTVILSRERLSSATAKKRLLKSLYGENSGNYRVLGWIRFPLVPSDGVSIYGVFDPKRAVLGRGARCRGDSGVCERAVEYAGRDLIEESKRGVLSIPLEDGGLDRFSATLFAYVALGAMEAIDAVNLRKTLFCAVDRLPRELMELRGGSLGFLRVALLVASVFCDGMGGYGEEFYLISAELRRYAERLRVEWECGAIEADAPFLPCEVLAFRRVGGRKKSFFVGFTAPKRLCDRFLYLFSEDRAVLGRMAVELLTLGFGERGIETEKGDRVTLNALLLAICAEKRSGTFSGIMHRTPELRACRVLFSALP